MDCWAVAKPFGFRPSLANMGTKQTTLPLATLPKIGKTVFCLPHKVNTQRQQVQLFVLGGLEQAPLRTKTDYTVDLLAL